MAKTRTETLTSVNTSEKDIYEGLSWRGLTNDEHLLIVRLQISLLDGMSQFDREFATRDMVNQILINKLVNNYPAEKAQEGFYQTITYEGQETFAIHPLAMCLFDQIACDLYRIARTIKNPADINRLHNEIRKNLKNYLNITYGYWNNKKERL